MNQELIVQIAGIIIGGLGTIFLALFVWGLKALISSVLDATTELKVIKEQLKTLVEDTKAIPKMKEDINALHGKVRGLDTKN